MRALVSSIMAVLAVLNLSSENDVFARDALSEVQLFHRCYSQITGLRATSSHPQLAQVQTGARSAIDACLDVFAKANLLGGGANEGLTTGEVAPADASDTIDAQAVLSSFQNYHKSWFQSGPLHTGAGLEQPRLSDDIWSRFEAADHVTRLLFSPAESYRQLIRGVRSIKEIRERAPTLNRYGQCINNAGVFQASCVISGADTWFRSNFRKEANNSFADPMIAFVETFTPPLFQIGKLRGLKQLTDMEMSEEVKLSTIANSFPGNTRNADSSNYLDLSENGGWIDNVKEKYRKPFGAGAIGTQSYLQMNADLGMRTIGYPRTDGGGRVWRRLSQAVLREFMCRDLPVLNAADATPYVRSPMNPLPWQTSNTCMSCHTTIDGMAGVSRNIAMTTFHEFAGVPVNWPNSLELNALISHPTHFANSGDASIRLRTTKRNDPSVAYAASNPNGLFGITGDNTWFRQAPKGLFLMRDMNGTLINQEIYGLDAMPSESSLPGLSDVVTNTDDYYVCAAKRYFKFFTDHDVSMLDVPDANPHEVQARDFIVSEGLALKQHQSLQYLIRQILSSRFYKEGI